MTELPESWTTATLDDLAAPGRPICYGILMPKEHVDDGVPYVKVKDFPNGAIDVPSLRRTSPAISEKYRRSSLRSGDVLVSIRGTYGRVAIVPESLEGGNITQDTARVTPSGAVLNRYLAYLLRSVGTQGFFRRMARGVAVKGVNIGDLKRLPVPLAPRGEQDRIVAAIEEQFSRLEDAERLLERATRNAARLRAATLAAVSPVDVPWTTLGDIAEVVGGVTKDSKRQGDPAFVEVPYLRVANVQRGYLDLREITTIRVPPEKAKALRLEPGDILFNEGGDRDKLGRGWVWNGEIEDCIHQNHVFRARLLTPEFEPTFVSMHGNTFGQRWFEQMGKQTTNLASINLRTLKAFPVPIIPVEEQRRRVENAERQLSVLDSLTTAIDHALTRGEHLRRSILEQAYSGRLVRQDPSDEPASQLLARVSAETSATPQTRRQRA